MMKQPMDNDMPICLEQIVQSIGCSEFSEHTLHLMDNYINNILNGKTNLTQFNQAEHAGLCRAGEMLIGAYIVCNYARTSLEASCDAATSQASPANWEIDEMVAAKGFRDNYDGQGVNYIGERLCLEDMHPANVFVDEVSNVPICIDCIVKFVRK